MSVSCSPTAPARAGEGRVLARARLLQLCGQQELHNACNTVDRERLVCKFNSAGNLCLLGFGVGCESLESRPFDGFDRNNNENVTVKNGSKKLQCTPATSTSRWGHSGHSHIVLVAMMMTIA